MLPARAAEGLQLASDTAAVAWSTHKTLLYFGNRTSRPTWMSGSYFRSLHVFAHSFVFVVKVRSIIQGVHPNVQHVKWNGHLHTSQQTGRDFVILQLSNFAVSKLHWPIITWLSGTLKNLRFIWEHISAATCLWLYLWLQSALTACERTFWYLKLKIPQQRCFLPA